ncbi:hypothetical protein [Psychroflexus maritimus]|uniref:DUF3311 domain-containing protein n=1 Tax=Psychroflexus maritimus TaxID=2714865 RepID=A0A967AM87_9FLAO|nr:hypothetical protein [Psychroflexus maritimus]NGZ90899.1 hypothetical protein [Psychroflexus maritimus]
MKKRHQQKLIILGIGLIFLFNFPFIATYNSEQAIFGFPMFYFFVFIIWLISIIVSYLVLKKYFD